MRVYWRILAGNGKKGNRQDATFEQQEAPWTRRETMQPKEFEMFSHRLFNFIVAIGLLVVIGLTVREASAATTALVSHQGFAELACESLPSHDSIHTEYVTERGVWVTYTEDGPTGIDGGLINLLSNYRTCSK